MKICFITRLDPRNHRSFSGTYYQMFSNLSKHHEVDYIGKIDFSFFDKMLIGLKKIYTLRILKKQYNLHNTFYSKLLAKYYNRKLRNANYDILFAPAASECIAYLKTNIPIVYSSDATFENMIDYYPKFVGLSTAMIEEGNLVEKKAIDISTKSIFSSQWAASSAINFYKAPASKISIVDFGANFLYAPSKEEAILKADRKECNLFFIGVDWIRKGGDLCYKTFLYLRSQGFNCKLTIMGCKPDIKEQAAFVNIIPFLDKNKEEDFKVIYDYFKQAHFLLLPTRADCSPIVFCEAAAFGLPVITTKTGGVPSLINEGKNGYMLPPEATEEAYANIIKNIFEDETAYSNLCASSRNEYETRLNWATWAERVSRIIEN